MTVTYPDWKTGETIVVKRWCGTKEIDGEEQTVSWKTRRSEVEKLYGRIYEDVIPEEKAESLGWAYFRIRNPWLGDT